MVIFIGWCARRVDHDIDDDDGGMARDCAAVDGGMNRWLADDGHNDHRAAAE